MVKHIISEMTVPELLAPAGSPEALEAALLAGADAVYLGGSHFNARMNARNFDTGELREAVTEAHRMGGRVYLTLNTLLWDRELPEAVAAAYEAASAGVDALIIADMGAAALIRRALPELPLHASTQLSGHNARIGEVLAPFGFSRYVIARETSLADLASAVRNNPLEVEVFVHGALCVSHSGQCLFSSLVGGRSGNRGECAQPCRLPYACAHHGRKGASEGYPLSLKDLTLAAHVPTLLDSGVASLKIEGRMKSAGYVSGVVQIWRRLLDERRAATKEEIGSLAALFSRDGFTDGYGTGHIDHRMMGVRTDADKDTTAQAEKDALSIRHMPCLPMAATLSVHIDKPVRLELTAPLYRQGSAQTVTVTVERDAPLSSEGLALTYDAAEKQLSRTGGTPYRLAALSVESDEGTFVPASRLNALRRDAVAALDSARLAAMPRPDAGYIPVTDDDIRRLADGSAERLQQEKAHGSRVARFCELTQITADAVSYFDLLFLPIGKAFPPTVPMGARGYILPPVIFDHEAVVAKNAVAAVVASGVRHFLVGNFGHLPIVWEACGGADVCLHGDFRLGVTNTPSLALALELGFADVVLSPELTIPRMRDIVRAVGASAVSAVVYGRMPLMLLEKCAIREIYADRAPAAVCRDICDYGGAVLTDRMGKRFPVLREDFPNGEGHRNTVYNSVPVSMSDRPQDVASVGMGRQHFIFSTETPDEVDAVIVAYRSATPIGGEVRRMMR